MIKRYRHLNFFQHDCFLPVRVPRVTLPDGQVLQVEPAWVGERSGFTLLFEAMVLALCREMPFAVVARRVGESGYRVRAVLRALRRSGRGRDRSVATARGGR